MKRQILICALISTCGLASSRAAEITWQAPFNITSVSSIDTTGTLVEAKNANADNNSQTVNVGGENILFAGMSFPQSNTNTGTFFTAGGGDTGNAQLNTVLNSHSYDGGDWSFSLTGLNSGTDYQIQIIGAGDTRNCCSSRNQRAGDGESPESVSGDFSRSGVGSVIGTFTASGSTQVIHLLEGINNGTDPGISAYILREVAPPMPQPPTDLVLSNTDLAPSTGSGTLVGTLSTVDPNPDDTHSYSLILTGSFPDNSLFTIANGNELRAASNLGGFGATYTIRLRTTDSDSLTRDETFDLQVEAAQAPSALSFSSTTILNTTPNGGTVGSFSTVDGNSADAHSYTLIAGAGSNDNGLFTISGDTLELDGALPGLGSILSIRVRTTDLSGLSIEETFAVTVVGSSVRINEFLADNTSNTLADEDGDTPDWIELHNPDGGSVSLSGYYLTDNAGNLTKWQFPAVSISGNGFLVVFASSKDRSPTNGDNLHTNFGLGSNGEYVALVAPDGVTVLSEFGSGGSDYPEQKAGNTYGFYGDPLQIGFMLNPTPNAANDDNSGVFGFVEDTDFSVSRGFYDSPFQLSITSATPGATIRYTTNGDWPSETSGTIYSGPINVNRTMPVKAITYRAGYVSTNIDTHTYILTDSVLTQTSGNTQSTYGLPSSWDGQSPYYGMNNNSNVNPGTHPTIEDDLKTVPSLSISLDVDDMFGSQGIYSNPGSSGSSWERKTSLELVDPADPTGGGNFQQNCAIRIQGGAFRGFGLTRKKSFRVLFKSQFGTSNQPTGGQGKLSFPMFGEAPGVAQEFQTLTFRMESNDGWQWSGAGGQPQYARDEFGRRAQLALGQPASHGRYLHIYINGVYWGVYNVVERPDASFAESYIEGATRDDWEGQNSGSPTNSAPNLSTWNAYRSELAPISTAGNDTARDRIFLEACGFNTDGSRNPGYTIWCDPNNNIDYFLVNWYAGNSDWPFKNYYGGVDTIAASRTGYKYFMWDAEWSFFLRSNTGTNKVADFRGIQEPNDDLEESPEYQMRFADRAHRAMFNGGPLSPDGGRALYEEITADHTSILVPEAARWGDQHGQNRHVADWQNEYDRIINDWFPVRTNIFLDQLRARDLYPDIAAPIFSQHGGSVPSGSGPELTVPQTISRVYYMYGPGDADPSDYEHSLDPRLVGGGINPAATLVTLSGGKGGPSITRYIESGDDWNYLDDASDQGTAWRNPGFDDSTWPSGPSQLGYGDGDEDTEVNFVDFEPGTPGTQKNPTTYFRTTVDIPDPSIFDHFVLNYVFDDSIAVYVNGTQVARRNLANNAGYDDYGNGTSGDNANGTVMLATTMFVAGTNTIAAEVHQDDGGSSDISFDLDLTGNPPGGGNTHSSDPLSLTEPGWLFSRSYNQSSGEWSALNTAFFTIDTVPADASNLIISEFNYHPAEPEGAEALISSDRDDFEFVELMNVGAQPIDLTGVRFTDGITFDFADNTTIPSGGRLVLVKDRAAFEERYAAVLGNIVFATDVLGSSEYSGRLSNDGEQILLLDANDAVIRDFTYNDQLPWPTSADGLGFSMVLKSPAIPIPDHGVASSWVASDQTNGAPGDTAGFGFAGDPMADDDGDGFSALLEYFLGTSDTVSGDTGAAYSVQVQPLTVADVEDIYLTATFTRNLHSQNALTFDPQISPDLSVWAGSPAIVLVSEADNGDGTSTLIYRSENPVGSDEREFIRVRVTQ